MMSVASDAVICRVVDLPVISMFVPVPWTFRDALSAQFGKKRKRWTLSGILIQCTTRHITVQLCADEDVIYMFRRDDAKPVGAYLFGYLDVPLYEPLDFSVRIFTNDIETKDGRARLTFLYEHTWKIPVSEFEGMQIYL